MAKRNSDFEQRMSGMLYAYEIAKKQRDWKSWKRT